jgi:REP element-mobilizing transposase RayT
MAHTYSNFLSHIVFSTYGRAALIVDEIRDDVYRYLGGILRELRAVPIIAGGMPDHVHLPVRMPADLSPADCVRTLKSNSTGRIKGKWPKCRSCAWQGGYGGFGVGESQRAAVVRYIQGQPQHHRKLTFQEEFLALLKKHGVEFDERHLWQ